MRTFKTKPTGRFAAREGIEDGAPCKAVERVTKGLIDADLGDGIIKRRIARQGQGRSGEFRVIVAHLRGEWAFFVHGFAKRDRGNLRPRELRALRSLAVEMLGLGAPDLDAMLANGTISGVNCDEQAV